MIDGVSRQGGYPGLPAGVGFAILNSCKIHFGGSFASLLKVARAASECRRASITKKRGLSAFFLVYVLSDHSVILRKCTPGWRGCKIACKGGLFFLPHLRGLPHLSGVPHLHVKRPLQNCPDNYREKNTSTHSLSTLTALCTLRVMFSLRSWNIH